MRHLLNIIPSLALASTSIAAPLYPAPDLGDCDKNSTFETLTIQSFDNRPIQVQWSDAAGKACPGEKFPRIAVRDDQVAAYVHLIYTDSEVPKELASEFSWNPLKLDGTWTFLDVSQDDRTKKSIFYTRGKQFHDNPQWGSQELVWVGSVYGLSQNKRGEYTPIFGISWGFTVSKGKPSPLRPERLDARDWAKDLPIYKAILKEWKDTKVRFNSPRP